MNGEILKQVILAVLLTSFPLDLLNGAGNPVKESGTFKKATEYFYSGKFEMAKVLFEEELGKNPENSLAYSYLGDIHLNKKQYDKTLELYRKALELNPACGEDYFRIGQVFYYQKNGNAAIDNFRKAREMNPKYKFALYHIGLTYLIHLRDKENTIKSWEEYLRIAPEDPQYEKIRRAIELLRDPNFVIPPLGSDIPIEEALHLGGSTLKLNKRTSKDKKAGHEQKKTKDKIEDINRDDDL
jgi:tetratricopeptide (TPR) repeat protein